MRTMKRRRIILCIGIAGGVIVLLFVLLAIPFRAWTRAHLAPTLTQVLYGTNTGRIFNNEFSSIREKFSVYGFELIDKTTLPYDERDGLNTYEPLNGCRVEGYEGFRETITCQKVGEHKPVSPDEFKKQWTMRAPEFIEYIEGRGWHKTYPDQPSYRDLFNGPKSEGRWLTYAKTRGKVRCELTVAYNPPYSNPDDQIWIHEQCSREVRYFGGY